MSEALKNVYPGNIKLCNTGRFRRTQLPGCFIFMDDTAKAEDQSGAEEEEEGEEGF